MEVIRKVSSIIIALVLAVAVLGTSAIYLALQDSQQKPVNSIPVVTSPVLGASGLPRFDVVAASGEPVSSAASANVITVSGSGSVSYTPNEALVQVSVQTTATTASEATSSNAQTMSNVIRALNGIGVANSSLQTSGFSLSVNYANCDTSCTPSITGYTVTNSLQVNLTSSDSVGLGQMASQVIDTSVKAGATGISLSFGATASVSNQLYDAALQRAVASADNNAKVIATSLGVTISGVVSASEAGSNYPSYGGENFITAAVATVQTPIIPGTQTVSASVQVVYSIS